MELAPKVYDIRRIMPEILRAGQAGTSEPEGVAASWESSIDGGFYCVTSPEGWVLGAIPLYRVVRAATRAVTAALPAEEERRVQGFIERDLWWLDDPPNEDVVRFWIGPAVS